MPRTASKREVRNVKDPPVRHFGTIFFNDNDIYVGEYILGKRNSKVRDGWGVELRHHGERYEGEWRNGFREGLGVLTCANSQRAPPLKLSEDLQPGQPCKDFIGAERYTGHFKRGVRHGIGISVTSCGTLMREAWRRQGKPGRVKKPQLLQRTPLFLYSEKSDKEKTSEERKRDKLRKIERSRISRILEWSVREVQFFSACLGIGPATQSKIDTHQIDGDAFLSIISPDSADLVKDLFPLEESSKTGTSSCGIWPQRPDVSARHRILIATVDFFHRALHKLSEPQPTEKDLKDQFPSLNIPKADLQLTGYVGEGGFGRVYSGIYKDARVAAKSTEGTRERKEILYIDPGPRRVPVSFFNEISILKKLQHPNVPALLGYSLPDHVIVMELVPGQSLHDVLHSRKRTTYLSIYRESDFRYQDIVHVSKEICSGMAYIHAQNIVHCDVKTQNILVSGHRPAQDATSCWGTWSCWSGGLRDSPPLGVKICDFGFASELDDGYKDEEEPEDFYKKTIHVGCLGTYHYMAPEVFRAEGYSKASDVYSFGMVLWEMITRRVPFKDYTAFQVMAEVGYARKLPQPPDVCPFSLQKLLYSALRIEPAERQDFSTLAETCAQLESPKGIELEAMFWYWLAAV